MFLTGIWSCWWQVNIGSGRCKEHFCLKKGIREMFLTGIWSCLMAQSHYLNQCWLNIGSGNGLVPSGIKQLPEPVLTKIRQLTPYSISWATNSWETLTFLSILILDVYYCSIAQIYFPITCILSVFHSVEVGGGLRYEGVFVGEAFLSNN